MKNNLYYEIAKSHSEIEISKIEIPDNRTAAFEFFIYVDDLLKERLRIIMNGNVEIPSLEEKLFILSGRIQMFYNSKGYHFRRY